MKPKSLVYYLILSIFGIATIIPLLWMVSASLMTSQEVTDIPPPLLPESPNFSNYIEASNLLYLKLYVPNTLLLILLNCVGIVLSASMAAYALQFGRGRLTTFAQWSIFATMLIPTFTFLLPVYMLFHAVGLLNTYVPLTFPAFLGGSAFYIFVYYQYFKLIPENLYKNAIADGASQWKIYWDIFLPLARPATGVVVLFVVIHQWNNYLGPLLILTSPERQTLALGLAGLIDTYDTSWNVIMAANTITVVPMLVLLVVFHQRIFDSFEILKGR